MSVPESKIPSWKHDLAKAARCVAKVKGWEKIEHRQHAQLVVTALAAFGDDARATFYIEQRTGLGNVPRPDLILLHPDVGILVIENKGVDLAEIRDVNGTELTILRSSGLKKEDPFAQASKVMFRLKDLATKRCDEREVLFLHTAALPRITRAAFGKQFGVTWPPETLFAEECGSPAVFRTAVLRYANEVQRRANRSMKFSKEAGEAVYMVLKGKSFLYGMHTTYATGISENSLGWQVMQLEHGLKDPTHQQSEYGRADLRGQHRLFRGVAGSGKSILLALSAAQTAARFADETGNLFAANASPKRVLVVCYNRTLVHYLRERIDDRYGRLTWDTPGEKPLSIMHFERVVKQLEEDHPALATGLTFEQKAERARLIKAKLDAMDPTSRAAIGFDAVYVDEAQDLLPEEISLLLTLARPDDKGQQTFVVFYDNAQNIYGVTPPVWEKLGVNIVGRTVFLDECLRNTQLTLKLAFNVLVGAFAPEGQRVTTRRFADVASLRERGLVSEQNGVFDVSFAKRTGPPPVVWRYATRRDEVRGVADEVKRLVQQEHVAPSDILILYRSHFPYKDDLRPQLEHALGDAGRVREVRSDLSKSKSQPLIEDGTLTVSTIASAKGYDAPIVFLLGVDELPSTNEGRANFYVGATRAKLTIYLTGIRRESPSLLDEVMSTARSFVPGELVKDLPPRLETVGAPAFPPPLPKLVATAVAQHSFACKHCNSTRLHAQHGRFGYYFVCIDCAENSPFQTSCPKCGQRERIRKAGDQFTAECEACSVSRPVFGNTELRTL